MIKLSKAELRALCLKTIREDRELALMAANAMGQAGHTSHVQMGAGGPDNSPLGIRGIRGVVRQELDRANPGWAQAVGMTIANVDEETVRHRWIAQVPSMRRHLGGFLVDQLRNESFDVTNQLFSAAIELSRDDMRRDKTGQLRAKIPDLAKAAQVHWNELGLGVIEDNDVGYDGLALFSSAHVSGDSGTQNNELTSTEVATLNVTTPAAPTKDEVVQAILGVYARSFTYLDDKGQPTNQGASEFDILVPAGLLPAFSNALFNDLNSSGGTNERKGAMAVNGQLVKFTLWVEPRLASGTQWYLFNGGATGGKALLLQEETAPEVESSGTDYDLWVTKRVQRITVTSWRQVAPGLWQQVQRATFS